MLNAMISLCRNPGIASDAKRSTRSSSDSLRIRASSPNGAKFFDEMICWLVPTEETFEWRKLPEKSRLRNRPVPRGDQAYQTDSDQIGAD